MTIDKIIASNVQVAMGDMVAADLAAASGLSQERVDWIIGGSGATVLELVRLGRVLGVDPWNFCRGEWAPDTLSDALA